MKQPSFRATLGVMLVIACTASAAIMPQSPAGVIGEVVAVTNDHRSRVLTMKTESGRVVSIVVDEATQVKRLAAGERSLEDAQTIAAADIAPGDRVYARGAHPDDSGTGRARQLIVMSRIDVEEKIETQRREWQSGVAGVVIALNRQAQEITVLKPGGIAAGPVVVAAVASPLGRDGSRFTAIALVAGVDTLIMAVQKVRGSRAMPVLSAGLPPGILDFALGQP